MHRVASLGTSTLDAGFPDEERSRWPSETKEARRRAQRRRRGQPEEDREPMVEERYGRWVPGGDAALTVEDIANKYLAGQYDWPTAVRLTEAVTDATGRHVATKRDLLVVLSRRER